MASHSTAVGNYLQQFPEDKKQATIRLRQTMLIYPKDFRKKFTKAGGWLKL